MNDRFSRLTVAATLLLAACGGDADQPTAPAADPSAGAASSATARATARGTGSTTEGASPAGSAAGQAQQSWDLAASGEGTALVYPATGSAAIRLFCPAGEGRILVNLPGFRPIGSEERLSFGDGGNAHALVADPRGDRLRGGVSATGAVPGNLAALLGGEVAASYGAQTSGPYPAPPAGLVRGFVTACSEGARPRATPTASSSGQPGKVSACQMQDGERLTHAALRAVGTEPFWGARIEGRCVTYSHPDDQQGTRVWTRYTPRAGGGGSWSGALAGKPFTLTARPQPGCSDGMSDNRYPLAVDLLVNGDRRTGCATTG